MSNRAIWDVRQRHVWLATPAKGKRLKRRSRNRIGLQAALDLKAASKPQVAEAEAAKGESPAEAS